MDVFVPSSTPLLWIPICSKNRVSTCVPCVCIFRHGHESFACVSFIYTTCLFIYCICFTQFMSILDYTVYFLCHYRHHPPIQAGSQASTVVTGDWEEPACKGTGFSVDFQIVPGHLHGESMGTLGGRVQLSSVVYFDCFLGLKRVAPVPKMFSNIVVIWMGSTLMTWQLR